MIKTEKEKKRKDIKKEKSIRKMSRGKEMC